MSTFEVAISEFIRKNLVKNPALFGVISSFLKLSKKTQLIVAAGLSERTKTENVENTIKAIEIRNALIHDGSEPPSNSTDKLTALFNVTTALVSEPEFRFLTATPGNIWQPKEKLGKKKS